MRNYTCCCHGYSEKLVERVPSYKDQITRLQDFDLDTYGFFGYPVLQSADILVYRAGMCPSGPTRSLTWN
ncbi:MAG: hypothetical protein CM1200mP9_00560 [Gammaproteobacteria bacterium]|nr:MAG: hypothetical protein CM1200mP9_00560 [Gammaproteobacteria bacterium]